MTMTNISIKTNSLKWENDKTMKKVYPIQQLDKINNKMTECSFSSYNSLSPDLAAVVNLAEMAYNHSQASLSVRFK